LPFDYPLSFKGRGFRNVPLTVATGQSFQQQLDTKTYATTLPWANEFGVNLRQISAGGLPQLDHVAKRPRGRWGKVEKTPPARVGTKTASIPLRCSRQISCAPDSGQARKPVRELLPRLRQIGSSRLRSQARLGTLCRQCRFPRSNVRSIGWLLLILLALGWVAGEVPLSAEWPDDGGAERQWRRTRDGWEHPRWRDAAGTTPASSLHPAVVGLLELFLAVGVLTALGKGGSQEDACPSPAGSEPPRFLCNSHRGSDRFVIATKAARLPHLFNRRPPHRG